MPKQVLVIDSTQIATHYECATKWDLGYRQSLGDMMDIDEPITMGTYGHKLLEIYYKNKDGPLGVPGAVKLAFQFNPDKEDKMEEKFPLSPEVRTKIRERFKDYWMKYYISDYASVNQKIHSIKVREDGTPYDHYDKKPLVELGFSTKLFESREYLFVLEGKIDWIAHTPLGVAFVDHKFQLRGRNLYQKSVQFKNYSLATGLRIGIINYIRLKDKLDEETLVRSPMTFDEHELKYWKSELIDHYVVMAKQVKSGQFPRNWDACSGKFGYFCDFAKLCPMAHNPRMYQISKGMMTKRKEWKPW